jgi:PKD repeat protein
VIEDIAVCSEGQVTFSANASGIVNWYSDSLATNFLDTGSSYTSPFLIETTSFYAENVVEAASQFGGKFDNSGGGSMFTANASHYLVFDCFAPTILTSVKVYADGTSNRIIQLRDANSIVLESTSISIPDGESRITLNWEIQPGTNYQLAGPTSPSLYRNNNGINYPYDIGDLIKIKHSSASSSPYGYYYFFYDWELKGQDCYSPLTEATGHVFINMPVCDFDYISVDTFVTFNNLSSDCFNVLWNFGDGTFSELENPVHTFAEGHYTIGLTAINPCGSDSITKEIEISIGSNIAELSNISEIKIFPNPAKEQVNISFNSRSEQNIEIGIENIIGQSIFNKILKSYNGEFSETIYTRNLPKGIYILGIRSNNFKSTKKIVIH